MTHKDLTRAEVEALIERRQPDAALRKWLNSEAMAAYGGNLVDDPSEHEAAQADDLIGRLAAQLLRCMDQRDAQKAENARLREALREIAGMDLMSASAVAFNALKGESHD